MSNIADVPASQETKVDPTDEVRRQVCQQLGITLEQLEAAKREHKKLETVSIGGRFFVYRPIRRAEHQKLREVIQALQLPEDKAQPKFEEKVTALCTVFPPLSEDQLRSDEAGIASVICNAVSLFSGYVPDGDPVKL